MHGILSAICLGSVLGLALHFAMAPSPPSALYVGRFPLHVTAPTAPTPAAAVRPFVPGRGAPPKTVVMAGGRDGTSATETEPPRTSTELGSQQSTWTLPSVLASVAFLGGVVAGRLWGRREAVAVAPTSGYTGDYFSTVPRPSTGRLQPLWGRRSAKIAMTKGREDLRRAKLYARFGKMIAMAVKAGGSTDESANLQLREVIRNARDANVPMANIERALKRGQDTGSADYKESVFEAYGKGGAGIIITVLSDNANRASSDVKSTIGKAGLTVASPGSVAFNFKRMGAIVCPKEVSEDLAIEAAMDAEVDDVFVKEGEDGEWLVVTEPKSLSALKAALVSKKVECGETKLIFHPTATAECSDEDYDFNMAAIERLEDLDDVDAVHHNMA